MGDILEKLKPLIGRMDAIAQIGPSAVDLTNEQILSPTRGIINGRETVLAGTNNYMGVTLEKSCIEAGKKALEEFGTGTTGSRIANGTYGVHKQLEAKLAEFLDVKHCIVFSTGYAANLGMIAGVAGPKDTIYLDADSHSSIYDGCTLSGARLVRFRHNDPDDLAKRLERAKNRDDGQEGASLVVLEGIYSMFGDRAPMAEFVEVKKQYGYQLMMDEAHSFGVLGPNGRGLAEEAGLYEHADFIVGTFSKSVGTIGGFGAGNHPYFEAIRYNSRPYMFTASPTPSAAATAIATLDLLAKEPERRDRLRENSALLHNGFKNLGLDLACDVVSPVIAVKCADELTTVAMWNALLKAGVYVNIALPPGTPENSCLLRCSVSAAHTYEDIETIIALFGQVVGNKAA